jgi:hypothetical protein
MMTTKSFTPENRFHGFDIIRLLSMIAILVLHTNEAIFWTDLHPLPGEFSIYRAILSLAQFITYSGFTIIALSFFLIGKGRAKNFWPLMLFLCAGILVLASFQADPPFLGFYWEWDIYWFLLASLILIQAIAWIPKFHAWFIPLAFGMTLIPFWNLIPNSTDLVSQALVGICPPEGAGSWPLLPWIAWPVLFFCLGSVYKSSQSLRNQTATFSKSEFFLWLIFLAISTPYWGAFYGVPIGPWFYCHTLRQPPPIFWVHFVWVLFFMRLSLIEKVNAWLSRSAIIRWISNLCWSRHFGATYLAHLPLLGVGILLRDVFLRSPGLFDLYFIAVMPAAEIIIRSILKVKKLIATRVA